MDSLKIMRIFPSHFSFAAAKPHYFPPVSLIFSLDYQKSSQREKNDSLKRIYSRNQEMLSDVCGVGMVVASSTVLCYRRWRSLASSSHSAGNLPIFCLQRLLNGCTRANRKVLKFFFFQLLFHKVRAKYALKVT